MSVSIWAALATLDEQQGRITMGDLTEKEARGLVGYLAVCMAHTRVGLPLHDFCPVEFCVMAVPTQSEVDAARHMAKDLAQGLVAIPHMQRNGRS